MSWGTVNAETRLGPLARRTFSLASSELIPPIPVANTTPVSSLSTFPSISESCQASRAAPGSKSRHSPATLDAIGSGSISVRGPTPERPAVMASQYASTPTPTGVTAPSPVTTTRRTLLPHRRLLGDHQVGRLADGLDAGDLVIWDLDAELLLEGKDDLDQVERVGVQVLLEASVGRDLVRVDAELGGQDLPHGVDDFLARLRHLVRSPSCWALGAGTLPTPPPITCHASYGYPLRPDLPDRVVTGWQIGLSRSHRHTAVDRHDLAGDVAGLLAGQEPHSGGHVLRTTHAADRDSIHRRLPGLLAHGVGQLGRHVSRSDHIGGNAAVGDLTGHTHGEADQTSLRGRVVGLPRVADQADHTGDRDHPAPAPAHHAP